MKLGNLLKKFKPRLFGNTSEEPIDKSVAVAGGPIPGKDFRKLMQTAGKVTWPTMRGILFSPISRVYRKRPQLFLYNNIIATEHELGKSVTLQPDCKAISRRDARLHFLYESARQGNRIARDRRANYIKRRTARHRKLVEQELPKMFAAAMAEQGLGHVVGSGVGLDDMDKAGPTFK